MAFLLLLILVPSACLDLEHMFVAAVLSNPIVMKNMSLPNSNPEIRFTLLYYLNMASFDIPHP